MATMTIDVDAIDALGTDLASVAAQFDDANADSDRIADNIGQAELAEVVRDFAHQWDDTRQKLVDTTQSLSQAATQLAQAWRDIDQQGVDALTGANQ
jgi:hypothetical protein